MENIRLGVVGVGHLGRFHALNVLRLPGVSLVGVYDQNIERARTVASECGCKPFDDIDALLESVEGVSIAVPTDRHFEIGQHVLRSGIHCLMEKPIARDLDEADGLIALADKHKLVFQVGHIERFNQAVRALEGFDIHPRFIESHRLAQFNPRGTEVAVVLDLMIHDIDYVLHLVKSPVKNIDASGVSVVSDTIDIANARIRFENGCVANLTASRISQKQMRKMRIFQKDAYVSVDFLEKYAEIFHLKQGERGQILGEMGVGEKKRNVLYHKPEVPEGEGLQTELDAFVRTIRGEDPSAVSGTAAREALSVALKVLEQIASS